MSVLKSTLNVLRLAVALTAINTTTSALSQDGVSVHFADQAITDANAPYFPACVSHEAGHPGKPLKDRPGDIHRADCPPERYCINDCVRAGNPHEVAWWARCTTNKNYSAWFVGGGNAWVFPWKSRAQCRDEGTWGQDYDGLFRPRRVWLSWSTGREQAGLGAYETDPK